MVENSNQTDTESSWESEKRLFISGVELNVAPPLDLNVDSPALRYQKLTDIVSEYTVPRLLALHGQTQKATVAPRISGLVEIHELGRIILGAESDTAASFILALRDEGVSLDDLYTELLGPTAGYLGELWDQDRIDFVDVTLGVMRLQRLVMSFEGQSSIPDLDEKRKILLVGAPGEQHSLGNNIIQRFFRASGWYVWTCTTPDAEKIDRIAAEEWFGVVGFSLNLDTNLKGLSSAIKKIRTNSMNQKVGVIVGGSAIQRNPHWVDELGADGTAANGAAAVILAKKLLAAALV
jgi:MerR family transcriptional regulator, light-induced transcriptional regulator